MSRRILNFARQVKRKLKLKFAIDRDATEDLILDSMKSCDVFEGSNFQLPRNFIVVTGHSTMKLKEIHRSSTFAWSSSQSLPLLATGTVAGALDESFSNESHGQLGTWAPIDGHRTSLIEMRFIWELRR